MKPFFHLKANDMTSNIPNDKELRKQWLKKRFGSYEYHEELLKLHYEFVQMVKRALQRPEVKQQLPSLYKEFEAQIIPNFDWVPLPGTIDPAIWQPGKQAGFAREILDYNQYIGGDEYWNWLTPQEKAEKEHLWPKMMRVAHNIRYTVDGMWTYEDTDDWILDEEYTGPINWTANWKEEITSALGITPTLSAPARNEIRCEGGKPCPRSGYWHVWHEPNSRRYFFQDEILPGGISAHGERIWYWDRNQSA
jgi:hypothetical protein